MSFKAAVERKIEGEGASPAAKKASPKLRRVRGAAEPDTDDDGQPKKKKPAPTRVPPQWAGIANQMLAKRPGPPAA